MSSQLASPTAKTKAQTLRQEVHLDFDARYVVCDWLGRGAFATVAKVFDRVEGCYFALKIFDHHPTADISDATRKRNFYREVRTMFRLQHPTIVQLHTLLQPPSLRQYLLLEYCPGGCLRRWLQAHEQKPHVRRRSAAAIGSRLAIALDVAQEEGIVHLDLKPENVLLPLDVAGEPDASACKVADFGLARLLAAEEPGDEGLRRLSGSPAYMAPERFRGGCSKSSDIYSLGVILYELVVGDRPFHGTTAELANQHLHDDPVLPEDLSSGWQQLLTTLLSKEPEQRQEAMPLLQRLSDEEGHHAS